MWPRRFPQVRLGMGSLPLGDGALVFLPRTCAPRCPCVFKCTDGLVAGGQPGEAEATLMGVCLLLPAGEVRVGGRGDLGPDMELPSPPKQLLLQLNQQRAGLPV